LQSDFFQSGFLDDDGSAQAMDYIAQFFDFRKWYFANGILEVRITENNKLMGRCDEFVPLNVMMNFDEADKQILAFKDEAQKRREEEKN